MRILVLEYETDLNAVIVQKMKQTLSFADKIYTYSAITTGEEKCILRYL